MCILFKLLNTFYCVRFVDILALKGSQFCVILLRGLGFVTERGMEEKGSKVSNLT